MTGPRVPQSHAEALKLALIKGDQQAAVTATQAALSAQVDPLAMIQAVIVPTLIEVGSRFEKLEIFLPELIAAGVAGSAASALLEEALTQSGSGLEEAGTIVLGTVKGDIHDIGKNIFASLLKAHGYRVIDLGKDVSAQAFIEAAERSKAEVIAASALMSITRAGCRDVAQLLEELGLRDQYPLIVGGGSVDQPYADEIGAEAYAATAAGGVAWVSKLLPRE